MNMSLVILPTALSAVPAMPQNSSAAADLMLAYDDAFGLYHSARTDAEMDFALRAIESAERGLEALNPFI